RCWTISGTSTWTWRRSPRLPGREASKATLDSTVETALPRSLARKARGAGGAPAPSRSSVPRMRVKRIGYVGMRTHDVDGMTRFFRDLLGLEAAGEDETVTFQRLPTHRRDLVEVYAMEHSDIRMIPEDADFVIAFVVDDIREAMQEVRAAGLELVNE